MTDETDETDRYPDVETVEIPSAFLKLLQGEAIDDGPFELTYDYDHEYHFRLKYNADGIQPSWTQTFKQVEVFSEGSFALDIPIDLADDTRTIRTSQFMLNDIHDVAPTIEAVLRALAFHGIPQQLETLYRYEDRPDDWREKVEERRKEIIESD